MARFIPSSLISSISGSVSGFTFRHTKSGGIFYDRPQAKKIPGSGIQKHRQYVAQANKDWASLDTDTRLFWKEQSLSPPTGSSLERASRGSARLFYLGWRLRHLHCGSNVTFNTVPPGNAYSSWYIRLIMFVPGLGLQYYGYPSGYVGLYPRTAAWLSWPAKGTQTAGKTWRKIWPQSGQESKTSCVDFDQVVFDTFGYPPELTSMASGYYPWSRQPMLRGYAAWPNGSIGLMPDRMLDVAPAGYYFKIPPDSPVYAGYAP